MKYPILNISIEKWNSSDLMDYIVYDKFIYTKKDSLFNEFYKEKLFCDCNGQIFKAVKKADMNQKWRNWLSFIPNVWKTEIKFVETNKKITVEDLRSYFLDRISDLNENEEKEKWIADIKKAKTHSELINGK